MPKKKKQNGIGAVCSVITRFLHPRPLVAAMYPNAHHQHRTDGLLVLYRASKKVNRVDKTCIFFRHNDFDDNQLLHCVERYAKVLTEGGPTDIFDLDLDEREEEVSVAVEGGGEVDDDAIVNVAVPKLTDNSNEDIARLRAEGYGVDDENEPSPENIPTAGPSNDRGGVTWEEWDSRSVCNRRSEGHRHEDPKLAGNLEGQRYIDYFMHMLPVTFFKNVVLKQTNLEMAQGRGGEITWGKFMRFVGLWLLMSTVAIGCDRSSYWDSSLPSMWKGAPFRLGEYMSGWKFEAIIAALRFTDIPYPSYTDKFHEVRQMVEEWNANMMEVFIAGWVSCLDESMSIWTSRWTCPGFMFVPRKPHTMGNEYHSICCAICEIMFAIEMVEGEGCAAREREARVS